eukprot:scaffold183572_cov19-Prasinocladus_malaysianus.AAC.1
MRHNLTIMYMNRLWGDVVNPQSSYLLTCPHLCKRQTVGSGGKRVSNSMQAGYVYRDDGLP